MKIQGLCEIRDFQIFSPCLWLAFHYLRAEILEFQCSAAGSLCMDCAVGIASRSFSNKITEIFSCVSFQKFCRFLSMILFKLVFVYGVR